MEAYYYYKDILTVWSTGPREKWFVRIQSDRVDECMEFAVKEKIPNISILFGKEDGNYTIDNLNF